MNDKNFNSISKFSVPQSWIDGALSVTETKPKKTLPFIRLTRTLSFVASIILVCGIGIAVYFLSSDTAVPPVKPTNNSIVSELVEPTSETSDNNEKTETSDLQTEDTQSKETQVSTKTETTTPTRPTQKPDESNPDSKPGIKPTNKPQSSETESTEKPTDNPETPGIDPSEPIIPTEEIEPPWVEPTEEESSATPTEEPSVNPYYDTYVEAIVSKSKVGNTYSLYCKFVDSSGRVLGNSNLYDSSHRVRVSILSTTQVKVWYYPYQHNIITKAGNYTYYFYNSKGEVLYTGTGYFPVA